MRNRGKILFLIVASFLLSSFTGSVSISDEEPYKSMIGECHVLQQDMRIKENGCWSIGELILSPDESSCFKGEVGAISECDKFIISDIRRQRWGSTGSCPQMLIEIEIFNSGGVFIPLCLSALHVSWLKKPIWQRGDDLRLKEEYALPCAD